VEHRVDADGGGEAAMAELAPVHQWLAPPSLEQHEECRGGQRDHGQDDVEDGHQRPTSSYRADD